MTRVATGQNVSTPYHRRQAIERNKAYAAKRAADCSDSSPITDVDPHEVQLADHGCDGLAMTLPADSKLLRSLGITAVDEE